MKKPLPLPPNTPKAIKRRYQRRTAPWWTAVSVLSISALWSLVGLQKLYFPSHESDPFSKQSLDDRKTNLWLMLPVEILRLCGLKDHAIEVVLMLVFLTCALLAVILALLLFGFAPVAYWGHSKKMIK